MTASLQIPAYSVGTISIGAQSGGVWPVVGSGTSWLSTDGTPYWPISPGEWLICGGNFGIVGSIVDTTHLNLSYWSGGAVAAGASYQIFRFVPTTANNVSGLVQSLLAMLGNNGVRFTPDGSGNMLLQTLNASSSWVTVATINTATGLFAFANPQVASPTTLGLVKTGAGFSAAADGTLSAQIATTSQVGVVKAGPGVSVAGDGALTVNAATSSVLGAVKAGATANIAADGTLADAVGFRNRLRNASFAINQRSVSGAVTLAAGAYGHDGVKAGSAGATYTFAASGIDTTITVTAGSIILPVEAGMIEGGTFVLSHDGTAQVRVWQGTGASGSGSYAADPVVVSLTANTQANVEFGTGTILRPQLEPGATPTVFERRPPHLELMYCQRYYEVGGMVGHYIGTNASTSGYVSIIAQFKTVKRTGSVVVSISADGVAGRIRISDGPAYSTSYGINQADALNGFDVVSTGDVATRTMIGFGWTASAEI